MEGREALALALVAVLLGAGHFRLVESQNLTSPLTTNFYATSCPNVDQIVRDSIGASMNSSQIVGPSVLRLFAHDCFIGVSLQSQ
jgi:peroxidase